MSHRIHTTFLKCCWQLLQVQMETFHSGAQPPFNHLTLTGKCLKKCTKIKHTAIYPCKFAVGFGMSFAHACCNMQLPTFIHCNAAELGSCLLHRTNLTCLRTFQTIRCSPAFAHHAQLLCKGQSAMLVSALLPLPARHTRWVAFNSSCSSLLATATTSIMLSVATRANHTQL